MVAFKALGGIVLIAMSYFTQPHYVCAKVAIHSQDIVGIADDLSSMSSRFQEFLDTSPKKVCKMLPTRERTPESGKTWSRFPVKIACCSTRNSPNTCYRITGNRHYIFLRSLFALVAILFWVQPARSSPLFLRPSSFA